MPRLLVPFRSWSGDDGTHGLRSAGPTAGVDRLSTRWYTECMAWNVINTVIAGLSLLIAAWAFYRTVVAGNPIVDLVPVSTHPDRTNLVLHIRVRNPGRHAVILHGMTFRSPSLEDVLIHPLEDHGIRRDLELAKEQLSSSDKRTAPLHVQVAADEAAELEVILPYLKDGLDATLRWSKQTPIVFPWRGTRIARGSAELDGMAKAANTI